METLALKSICVGDLCWLLGEKLVPCLVVEMLHTSQTSPKTETEGKINRKLDAFGLKRCQYRLQLLPHKKSALAQDFSVIPFHFTTEIVPGTDAVYNRSLIQAMHIAMTWAIPGLENENRVGDANILPIRQDSGSDLVVDIKKDLEKKIDILPLGAIGGSTNCRGPDLARSAEPNCSPPSRPFLPKLPKIDSFDSITETNSSTDNSSFKLAPINSLAAGHRTNPANYPPEPQVAISTEQIDWKKPLKIISPAVKSSLYHRARIPQHLIDPNLLKELPSNGTLNLSGYFTNMGISHQINPEIRFCERQKVSKNPAPPPFPKLGPIRKARLGSHIILIGDWIEVNNGGIVKVEKIFVNQGLLSFQGRELDGKDVKISLLEVKGRFDPVFENFNGHRVVEECNWDYSKIDTTVRTVNLSD